MTRLELVIVLTSLVALGMSGKLSAPFRNAKEFVNSTYAEGCSPPPNIEKSVSCKRDGVFPLPHQCRAFIICDRDLPKPELMCCPPGLHFDHYVLKCLNANEARCISFASAEEFGVPTPARKRVRSVRSACHNPKSKLKRCTTPLPLSLRKKTTSHWHNWQLINPDPVELPSTTGLAI